MSPKINPEELFANAEIEEPERQPKGFHTLQFRNEKIKIKTKKGEVVLVASKEGWEELEKFTKTKSPTVMAKRLIAIAYNVNHSE